MDEPGAGRGAWCAGMVPSKRPGRPPVLPGADRRVLLLDAAATVFLAQGYRDATMHAIALQARMSKKTLYQVFPSKLALFDALIGDRIFGLPAPPDVTGLHQEEALFRLLLAIAGVLLLPDRVGLIRLIISAGPNLPELGTAFERLRLAHDLNPLETWLAAEQARGALPAGNVVDEAQLLFGMTIAEPILKALVNAPALAHAPSVEDSIRFAVRLFLRGLGR